MKVKNIALIGLGAIGSPIADILWKKYGDDFCLIASGFLRDEIEKSKYVINGERFNPKIASTPEEFGKDVDFLLVCVKNYHIAGAMEDIKKFVTPNTIILPLQNGLYSHEVFTKTFPQNIVLKGYMQGPNTEINGSKIDYTNPGTIHVGSDKHIPVAIEIYNALNDADVPVFFENDITHMVWKKWMLNVAGNSITALTDADYSMFKDSPDLQEICKVAMNEFLCLAHAVGVNLCDDDIDDVMDYYLSYKGSKKTSMLVDVINKRKTENEYLSGYAYQLAKTNGIDVPTIFTLYKLMKIKEQIYSVAKG